MVVFFVFHIVFANTVKYSLFNNFRGSRSQVTYKKATSKNLVKFTQKNMCRGLFFNKNVGLQSATLLKQRLRHKRFPVNFVKILRTTLFENIPG